MDQKDIDERRLQHEISTRAQEFSLREREVSVREREIVVKERESRWLRVGPWLALLGAVCVATVGAITNSSIAFVSNKNSLGMLREKFESDVILDAIKSGDSISSCRNLKYVLDLKLIRDSTGAIQQICKTPENAPALPKPGADIVTTGLLSLLRAARDATSNGRSDEALSLYMQAADQSQTNSAVDQIALLQAKEAFGRGAFTEARNKFDSAFAKLHTPLE